MISVVVFGSGWGIGGAFLAVPLLRGWGQILGRRRSFTGGIDWIEDQRRARAKPRGMAWRVR